MRFSTRGRNSLPTNLQRRRSEGTHTIPVVAWSLPSLRSAARPLGRGIACGVLAAFMAPSLASAGPPEEARRSFELPDAPRADPYGPRPADAPRLTLEQLLTFSLQNPLIEAAQAKVEAQKAVVDRTRFAWIPTIKTNFWLSPGVNIRCDDVSLAQLGDDGAPLVDPSTGNPQAFDFQYCRPGSSDDLDVQTIKGYLSQLSEAGVFIRLQAEFFIPVYTFGRLLGAKRLAKLSVVVAELEREQRRIDTVRRVHQAHASLLLARETLRILEEAWRFLQRERDGLEADLAPEFDADPNDVDDSRDPADQFELELGELELASRVRDVRALEANALAALWALAGDAAPFGFDIEADRLEVVDLEGGLKELAEYQRMAAVHRPEARLAEAGVEALRQREKLARSAFLPSLGVSVRATYGFGNRSEQVPALYYSKRLNYGSINFGLVMNWDLDFHTSTFGLRKARALRRSAQLQQEAAGQLMAAEIDRARRAVESALQQQALIAGARDRSWSLVLDQRAKQSIGSGDFTKLRSSLRQWAEYEFKRLEAIANHNIAVARLSRAVGVSLQRAATPAQSEDRARSSEDPGPGTSGASAPRPARLPGAPPSADPEGVDGDERATPPPPQIGAE